MSKHCTIAEPLPIKKEHTIWSEGYACTGQSSGAILHGKVVAYTFEEAILLLAEKQPDFKKYLSKYRKDKEIGYSYWGCRIFDNEQDARVSFG